VAAETGKAAGKYHLLRKYLLQQELDTVRARHHRCDTAHPPAVSLFEGVHDGETATARGSKEESRRGCHGGTKTRRRGGPGQHCNHSLFNTVDPPSTQQHSVFCQHAEKTKKILSKKEQKIAAQRKRDAKKSALADELQQQKEKEEEEAAARKAKEEAEAKKMEEAAIAAQQVIRQLFSRPPVILKPSFLAWLVIGQGGSS